ncbi:MAG TPA: hypothetical protein VFV22_02140 [Candidatus Paceibacterota bacterium]|nr:hypothetical protein [Candidatus Paceibacterota bacterium]
MQPSHVTAANDLLNKLNTVIIFPLMTLMTVVAMAFFLYGVFEYIAGGADGEARVTGRKHMLYGIIGFVVMFSAYAILKIAAWTFGCDISLGSCGSI